MSTLKFWFKNSRNISLPQSALPCLTAMILCIGQENVIWWLALPIFLGVCALHLGMNLADDYFDFKHDSRNRSDISSTSIRARMDKCSYMDRGDGKGKGKATVAQLGWAVVAFTAFALLMGAIALGVQWYTKGVEATYGILLYAFLGVFFGINYSGKPLELGYHGLGELVIGLIFGPLNMMGVCAALTGELWSDHMMHMLWMSIAVGAMVVNILYVHSVMEVNADAELDKMTFARLLVGKSDSKSKGAVARMIFFIAVFAILPFVILGTGICLEWWSPWYLMTLVTFPMSMYLIRSTRQFASGLPRNDKPRWWMGPMGNWNAYVEAGMDWFLIRWLLARNICTFFCLVLIVVHIVLACIK